MGASPGKITVSPGSWNLDRGIAEAFIGSIGQVFQISFYPKHVRVHWGSCRHSLGSGRLSLGSGRLSLGSDFVSPRFFVSLDSFPVIEL